MISTSTKAQSLTSEERLILDIKRKRDEKLRQKQKAQKFFKNLKAKDVYRPKLGIQVVSDKVLGKLDSTALVKPKTEVVPFKLTKLFGLTQA